jgi:hypothetical protein
VLEIAGKGLEIFKNSEPETKNQLLKIFIEDCIIEGKKARISLQKPFDKFVSLSKEFETCCKTGTFTDFSFELAENIRNLTKNDNSKAVCLIWSG